MALDIELPAHRLPAIDPNQRYLPWEAAAYLRISRAKLERYIAQGHLHPVWDGQRRFIPGRQLAALSEKSV